MTHETKERWAAWAMLAAWACALLLADAAHAQVNYTSNRTTWGGQAGNVSTIINFEEIDAGTPVSLQYAPDAVWPGVPAPVVQSINLAGGQDQVLSASGLMTVEFPSLATAAGIRLRPGDSARLRAWRDGAALEPAPTSVCAVPPGGSFSFCGLVSSTAFDTLTVENTLQIDARIDQIEIVAAPGPEPVTLCGVAVALLAQGDPLAVTQVEAPPAGECAVLVPESGVYVVYGVGVAE